MVGASDVINAITADFIDFLRTIITNITSTVTACRKHAEADYISHPGSIVLLSSGLWEVRERYVQWWKGREPVQRASVLERSQHHILNYRSMYIYIYIFGNKCYHIFFYISDWCRCEWIISPADKSQPSQDTRVFDQCQYACFCMLYIMTECDIKTVGGFMGSDLVTGKAFWWCLPDMLIGLCPILGLRVSSLAIKVQTKTHRWCWCVYKKVFTIVCHI